MKMKFLSKNALSLTFLTALMGVMLRQVSVQTLPDANGLIPIGEHQPWYALAVVMFELICVGFYLRPLAQRDAFSQNFVSANAKGGSICIALEVLAAVLFLGAMYLRCDSMLSLMQKITIGVGAVGGVLLLFYAYMQAKGKRPSFLFLLPLQIYMILNLILDYQRWSGEPNLFEYSNIILADVAAMLAVCQIGAFSFDKGKRRMAAFWCCFAIVFCAIVAVDSIREGNFAVPEVGIFLWLAAAACQLCGLIEAPQEASEEIESTEE